MCTALPRPSSRSGSNSRRYASRTMSWVALKNATIPASHMIVCRSYAGCQRPDTHHRHDQRQLRHQHPAPAATQKRQLITIQQRGPDELPDVRQLNQRKQSDLLEIDPFAAQPARYQLNQEEERQSRRESGEGADDDATVEDPSQERLVGAAPPLLRPDQSRKFSNCSGISSLASRNIAITSWRSSRFLPVIRIFSP